MMIKKSEIIKLCLSYNNVYKDFPFKNNMDYCTIRHNLNHKIFALIFKKDNKIWVNLKCEPIFGEFLKEVHEAVLPAFHMNKKHWISVVLDNSISDEEIEFFVSNSYNITKIKNKTKINTV